MPRRQRQRPWSRRQDARYQAQRPDRDQLAQWWSLSFQACRRNIDGRKTIPGHKRFDMPFWGTTMQVPGQEFTPASEAKVQARIDAMVNYIKSIQRQ